MEQRDAESAALTDRVAHRTLVMSEDNPCAIDDVAAVEELPPAVLDVGGIIPIGHEADPLAVPLLRVDEALFGGNAPNVALLVEAAEREQRTAEPLLREGLQHVALVFRGVNADGERAGMFGGGG